MFPAFPLGIADRGKPLGHKGFRATWCVASFSLLLGGCLVTASTYEAKTKEADRLREALAAGNREKADLSERLESLEKQLADEKSASEALRKRGAEQEEELTQLREEISDSRNRYEGSRITREQFIGELLEKEKHSGKKIQDLTGRLAASEAEREKLSRQVEEQERRIADLSGRISGEQDPEDLRRERDILLGRVERLQEERRHEATRRESRFLALAESLAELSPELEANYRGAVLRVRIPEPLLPRKGKSRLAGEARDAVGRIREAAAEFPESSVVVTAPDPKTADEIASLLTAEGKLPPGRVESDGRAGGKTASIYLLVP